MKTLNFKSKSLPTITKLLQLATFSVFLGRTWQHLYWDAPFRALLWDEKWLSGWVTRFTGMSWETYITSLEVDQNIAFAIKLFGLLYLICALIALFTQHLPRPCHHLLLIGTLGLTFLAFLYCKERFFSIGQFFEYALQFGSPFFLWWWMGLKASSPSSRKEDLIQLQMDVSIPKESTNVLPSTPRMSFRRNLLMLAMKFQRVVSRFLRNDKIGVYSFLRKWGIPHQNKSSNTQNNNKNEIIPKSFFLSLKIAIALTFTCHGLYAIGYYPIPVNFMDMTMNILRVDEAAAKIFLKTAGILDFIVAIGIFLPFKYARVCLLYALFWGFGTTIARIWAYFDWKWLDYVLLQWLHEAVLRMPHFLVPLVVLLGGTGNYFGSKDVEGETAK
ncbi:MAG: hypothetical protein AAGJ18_28420 [Bacteroidota bacterium]